MLQLVHALGLLNMACLNMLSGKCVSFGFLIRDLNLAFFVNLQLVHITLSFKIQLHDQLPFFSLLLKSYYILRLLRWPTCRH